MLSAEVIYDSVFHQLCRAFNLVSGRTSPCPASGFKVNLPCTSLATLGLCQVTVLGPGDEADTLPAWR